MYIENLSNQEITEKIKEFCNRAIATVHNDKRTSQDTYSMILEVDDWIKALTRIYRQNNSEEIMGVIAHLELMKACSENIGDGQRMSKDKLPFKLREMEELSMQLIALVDGPKASVQSSTVQKSIEAQNADQPSALAIKEVLAAEGIDHFDHIKISKID